jgi:DHA1 family bicyclomycin/chloramphenicol resistance-like MFS transporter
MINKLFRRSFPRLEALPRWEFITLCAALMALNALAIDIMLPGLQQIGASLGVVEREPSPVRHLRLFRRYGLRLACSTARHPIGSAGAGRCCLDSAIYILAALGAVFAPSFRTALLALRFIQGIGAASERASLPVSIVRDRFRRARHGRSDVAHLHGVHDRSGHRAGHRPVRHAVRRMAHDLRRHGGHRAGDHRHLDGFPLPETCTRRPCGPSTSVRSFSRLPHRADQPHVALCSTRWHRTIIFGALFGFINSAQQVYVGIYGLGVWFPVVFAGIAGMMALSSFLNSRLVGKFRHAAAVARRAAGFLDRQRRSGSCLSLVGHPAAASMIFHACSSRWRCSSSAGSARTSIRHLDGAARPSSPARPPRSRASSQTLGGGLIGAC